MVKQKINTTQFDIPKVDKLVKSDYYEYLIIISPSDEIVQDAWDFNAAVNNLLENKVTDPPSKPHITLIYHKDEVEKDELFLSAVKKVAAQVHCFNVLVKGFNFFKQGRKENIIYMAIDNKEDVKNVFKLLAKELHVDDTKFVPHITMKKAVYNDKMLLVMGHLEESNYNKQFLCDKIVLLKRKVVNRRLVKYTPMLEVTLLPS